MTQVREPVHEEKALSTADVAAATDRREMPVANRDMPRPQPAESGPQRPADAAASGPRSAPLFLEPVAQELRTCWERVQIAFVDDPRQAVQQADHLVAQTIKRLAEVFSEERNRLEQQWSRGDNVSTEDLRVALQRYRSFFDRLLSV